MNLRPLQIAIVAGEPSGDRQGAALVTALRERAQPRLVEAWGIGGAQMAAAGVNVRDRRTGQASIGVGAALRSLPAWLLAQFRMRAAVRRNAPDALVLIDSGAFNVPLARWVKARAICPVFYYFPPGSWRRTPGRGNLAAITDQIVTPFPWSADLLRQSGAKADFLGHPSRDLVQPTLPDQEFYSRFGLDPHRPLIALLPGSRLHEIHYILPSLIGAAGEISRRVPGVQFALALTSAVPRSVVEKIIHREQKQSGRTAPLHLLITQAGGRLAQITTPPPPLPRLATSEGLTLAPPNDIVEETPLARPRTLPLEAPLVICEDLTYDVMARSDLVITKSGTATLEAAILNKPMIIVYRGSSLLAIEFLLRRTKLNITHIGLPNILAQERLFPELLQDDANPKAIADAAVEMLLQPERLLRVKERLADLIQTQLGELGAVRRAADLLYETATANIP